MVVKAAGTLDADVICVAAYLFALLRSLGDANLLSLPWPIRASFQTLTDKDLGHAAAAVSNFEQFSGTSHRQCLESRLLSEAQGQSATNPEELIGAAHAGCFTMALTAELSQKGITPKRIHTVANVKLDKVGETFAITRVELQTEADIPGIDDATFQKIAHDQTRTVPYLRRCPVHRCA